MLSKLFWADALERAAKTACQAALATLGLGSVDVLSTNWIGVLSVGAGAAVVSILTSVASEPRSGTLSPASVVKV
jgi:Putative lactococcus lactis phage r1t holin